LLASLHMMSSPNSNSVLSMDDMTLSPSSPLLSVLEETFDAFLDSPTKETNSPPRVPDSYGEGEGEGDDDGDGDGVGNHSHSHNHNRGGTTRAPDYLIPPMMNAMNAVHMEDQENTKIPNSYHFPVQRRARASSSRLSFMDEIMRLSEADLALTENFLGSDHRMSKAAAYSNAGALMSSIGTKVAGMSAVEALAASASANSASANSASGVICTNNAETNHNLTAAAGAESIQTSTSASAAAVRRMSANSAHQAINEVRAYGRPVPLPIPTRVRNSPQHNGQQAPALLNLSQPTKLPATATATSTAAAAAAAAAATVRLLPAQNNLLYPRSGPAIVVNRPLSVQSQSQSQTKPASQSDDTNQLRVIPKSLPIITTSSSSKPKMTLHSAAGAPTTPSILEATMKRSQFGFGGNHEVPSVPLPPQTKSQPRIAPPVMLSKKPAPVPVPSPAAAVSVEGIPKIPPTEGPSYERKKQRAKDARVKLNESIERLSVAMNLAGTQSKERIKTHKGWSSPPRNESSMSMGGGGGNTATTTTTTTTAAVNIMEEVGKTADSAKKWDRPSFVGTAASVVQHLNSECEALMRELVQLKKERAQWIESKSATCLCVSVKRKTAPDAAVSNSNSIISDSGSFDDADKIGRGCHQGEGENENENENARKKRKIEEVVVDIYSIFQYERISKLIGMFLDPRSIIRSTSVSRSWQYRLACMKNDSIWSTLCVNRFGSIHVIAWQDQINEEEEEVMKTESHHDGADTTLMMNLYKRMNAANIKPKCHYEGNLHLGGGGIDNVACAWASLVERSNGETRRSVLSGSGGDIKYASLPVVELRILIQNVGVADVPIYIPEQIISVDASTKRSRGEEMFEISSDHRFKKNLMNLDGSIRISSSENSSGIKNLTGLGLFESTVICAFIHARSCPTMNKFRAKAKYVKVLVNVRGMTLPLVIPVNPL